MYDFKTACEKAFNTRSGKFTGIGELSERAMHRFLKFFTEPDESFHEVKIGRYVADVCKEGNIVEVQTRGLYRLKPKLDYFFKSGNRVNVIHPVDRVRRIIWTQPETGEVTQPRKSPKVGNAYDYSRELYSLREYIGRPDFTFTALYFDVDEYRLQNGKRSADGKKGSCRTERIPTAFVGAQKIDSLDDLDLFMPEGMPERFTARQFKEATRSSPVKSSFALSLLIYAGRIFSAGKSGRTPFYEIKDL